MMSELEEQYRCNLVPFIPDVKQCPFCGQFPDSTDCDFCYPILTRKNGTKIYRAGCIESAGGCGAEVLGDSVNDAVRRWNTRI